MPSDISLMRHDFKYQYPNNLNLKPGTRLHDRIADRILANARSSQSRMSSRYHSWNQIDQMLTMYISLDDEEKRVKAGDKRKPVSIVLPVIYSTLDILMTYMVSVFLQRPMFPYEARSPEDVINAALLEHLIQLHCDRSKVALNAYVLMRDGFAYGVGAATPTWRVDRGTRIGKRVVPDRSSFMSAIFGGTTEERYAEENQILYEGNQLENIDPYKFFPDPNFSIHDIQKSEFQVWVQRTNMVNMLDREKQEPDLWFNAKYVREVAKEGGGTSTLGNDNSARDRYGVQGGNEFLGTGEIAGTNDVTSPVDEIQYYTTICPKDWELGDGEYPEKWLFTLAADKVIVQARPLGLSHNRYPLVTCAPDFDGYSVAPMSRLEAVYPGQEAANFFINSHITNIRKTLNNMLVVDPSLVNLNTLKTPYAGGFIFLTKRASGQNKMDQAIQQLKIDDVTRQNIGDVGLMLDFIQRGSGATDMIGGVRRQSGERRTATEEQNTYTSAMGRIQKAARIISEMTMRDIGDFFARHAQELMSQESYVKATGSMKEMLVNRYGTERVPVSPMDILIDYDVVIKDGAIPGGNINALQQALQLIPQSPELSQRMDYVRLFKYYLQQMGVKNIDDFERMQQQGGMPGIDTQTMSPEDIQGGVDAGNLVPLQDATQFNEGLGGGNYGGLV